MQKLVRDKVVENIEKGGNKVRARTLNDEEFAKELKTKLREELTELDEVQFGDKEHFRNELADMQLLIDYLLKTAGISKEELGAFQKEKLEKTGGFEKRIFTEKVELQDDSEWVEYYRKKGWEEIK